MRGLTTHVHADRRSQKLRARRVVCFLLGKPLRTQNIDADATSAASAGAAAERSGSAMAAGENTRAGSLGAAADG